jgi:DNA-binding HxlR family transcriptional regulator
MIEKLTTGLTKAKTAEQFTARGEKLSNEKMGNLLSAVGNNEAKAITLILMRNGNIYSQGDLYRAILDAQGENKGWKMGHLIPFNYCSNSLSPIGLVAKEIVNRDLSTYGYMITEEGKDLGVPLAGLLLDFSKRHNVSLYQFLKNTNSSSKNIHTEKGDEYRNRSPSTTLNLLLKLVSFPSFPIREADLLKEMSLEHTSAISFHLDRLSKLGIIEYKTIEKNKPYALYKFSKTPEGELPIHERQKTMTNTVFNLMREHPDQYFTTDMVSDLLFQKLQGRWKNKKVLYHCISSNLSFLAKHGYLTRKEFNGHKQSEISLTERQRAFLTEFIEIIRGVQNQDKNILRKGRSLAEEIITSPKKVSNLLQRAKEASSAANKSPQEETQNLILSIIRNNPGIKNKEIRTLLKKEYGKNIGISNINDLSSHLVENDSIKIAKEGIVNKYYSTEI